MALYQEPETRRAEAAAYDAPRSLTASASRLHLGNRSEVEATRQRASVAAAWQTDAWQCYSRVGEVNYAFNYSAWILSRIRFFAGVVLSPNTAPVPARNAVQLKTHDNGTTEGVPGGIDPRLAELAEKHMRDLGKGGRMAPMVRAFALNVQVAGECYLCCINDVWSIRSTSEVKVDAAGYATLQPSASTGTLTPKRLAKGTPIGRIWNQHPQFSLDPDSSLRAVIDDCEEVVLLGRLSRVTARSRLNAGLLFVPDEMSATAATVGGAADSDPDDPDTNPLDVDSEDSEDEDEFEKELYQSMTAPVAQENDAAAIVPLLVRGPADQGDKIKYIQFARDIGEGLTKRSEVVLNRVLQGINAPKELTSGIGQTRYNNAKMIDEQSYKALVEPLALVFSDALTAIYLGPLLRTDAEVKKWMIDDPTLAEQIDRVVVWYDPSEVTTSVDQSQSANEGLQNHTVSEAAWRRAHGFGEDAKPNEEELARRLGMAQVAIPPEQLQALLAIAFPKVFGKAREQNMSSNGVGVPAPLEDILQGGGPGPSVNPSPPVPATSVPQGV